MSLWSELRRRNAYRVGAAYALVAWAVMNLRMNCLNDPLLTTPRFAEVPARIRGD